MPEMIKEDQYAEADPDGVGNLQDGKAGGTFSRNKSVKLAKRLPISTSLLKVIMEKAAPKKETRHTKGFLHTGEFFLWQS